MGSSEFEKRMEVNQAVDKSQCSGDHFLGEYFACYVHFPGLNFKKDSTRNPFPKRVFVGKKGLFPSNLIRECTYPDRQLWDRWWKKKHKSVVVKKILLSNYTESIYFACYMINI